MSKLSCRALVKKMLSAPSSHTTVMNLARKLRETLNAEHETIVSHISSTLGLQLMFHGQNNGNQTEKDVIPVQQILTLNQDFEGAALVIYSTEERNKWEAELDDVRYILTQYLRLQVR